MTSLLMMAIRSEGHGVIHHSLDLTAISALKTAVGSGNVELSQIATQGNYRDATAHDIAKI